MNFIVIFTDENSTFDLEMAIKALNNENVQDICCIEIPEELNYADLMLIGTCLSEKHLNSTFMSLNRMYKGVKDKNSKYLRRKLFNETKWCAMDTGKIVIHLFLAEYREYYDLESLWSCGKEFDEKYIEFSHRQSDIEKKLIVTEDNI